MIRMFAFILAYYFRRQDIPMDHLYRTGTPQARTIYVVRNAEADRQLPSLAGDPENRLLLIKEFPETLIYQKPGQPGK